MILVVYLIGFFLVAFMTAHILQQDNTPEEYTLLLTVIMGAIWPVIMVAYLFQTIRRNHKL